MKKLLFLVVVAIGGSALIHGNHAGLTSDGQVRLFAWTFPLPAAVTSSPLMTMITIFAPPRTAAANGPQSPLGVTQGRPAAAPVTAAPALPTVTSAVRTYNPNPSIAPSPSAAPNPAASGPANVADQFSAVSKALRPQ